MSRRLCLADSYDAHLNDSNIANSIVCCPRCEGYGDLIPPAWTVKFAQEQPSPTNRDYNKYEGASGKK